MKLKNLKDTQAVYGTSLKGYLKIGVRDLKAIFGDPIDEPSGDLKVNWEWIYEINDKIFTIYNYKDGPSYLGNNNITIDDIEIWHIGGKSTNVLEDIKILLDQHNVRYQLNEI